MVEVSTPSAATSNDLFRGLFLRWNIIAVVGMGWLGYKLRELCSGGGGQRVGGPAGSLRAPTSTTPVIEAPTSEVSVLERQAFDRRSVACVMMSTWFCGPQGRYSPTRSVEEGIFLNGLPITTFREVDVVAHDVSARRAMCRGMLPRCTRQCADCGRIMHEPCGAVCFFCDDVACAEHTALRDRYARFKHRLGEAPNSGSLCESGLYS